MKWKTRGTYLLSLLVSILLGLGVGALLMLVTGHDPIRGYADMLNGALGSKWAPGTILENRELGNTLYRIGLLVITGMATAVASEGGIFNVGGQGQMVLGAMFSAWLGASLPTLLPFTAGWPAWLAAAVCLLAGALAGALYALIPALMKTGLKINEVITTILMNTVAMVFCQFMVSKSGPIGDPRKGGQTAMILSDWKLERFFRSSNLSQAIFIVIGMTLLVWYLMSQTTFGYRMRMSGQNSRFAKFSGVKAARLAVVGMLISGALCGAAGMLEVFGWRGRFVPDKSWDIYWDGMLVAMIMHYKPLGIILMSCFFGILKSGAVSIQRTIPSELSLIIQSIIIFFMAAEQGMIDRFRSRRARRKPDPQREVEKA